MVGHRSPIGVHYAAVLAEFDRGYSCCVALVFSVHKGEARC